MTFVALRSNIWGEFRVTRNSQDLYIVDVNREHGLSDRRDGDVPQHETFVYPTREEAIARQQYEATRYKRYRYY